MRTNRYFGALLWFCWVGVFIGGVILTIGRGMRTDQPGGNLALMLAGAAVLLVGLIAGVIALGVAAVLHSLGEPASLSSKQTPGRA